MSSGRRCALAIALAAIGLAAAGGAPAPSLRRLTILHTNDLHATLRPVNGAGGLAHVATALARQRAGTSTLLHVDAGDIAQGSLAASLFRGVPVVAIANLLGIDVAALGNHEFDYGWGRIADLRRSAKFPMLAANVVDRAGVMMTPPGYVVRVVGGVRVGVIGALTEETNRIVGPRLLGPWRAAPVVPAVSALARALRPRVDIVMVLGHLSHREDAAILKDVPEVAFVVSGHNHEGRAEPLVVADRFSVKLPGSGQAIGRLDLTVDVRGRRVHSWTWTPIAVRSASYPADPAIAAMVDRLERDTEAIANVVIGEAVVGLGGISLKRLVERALADEMQADIAFVNQAGIEGVIAPGAIRVADLWSVIPFDTVAVTAQVRGGDLPAEIRDDLMLDSERTYRLVTSDFVADRHLTRYSIVLHHTERQIRDVVADWIRKQGRIP